MAKQKRRVFTDEFKADAVRLCKAGGRSLGQVATDLDIGETGLRAWLKQAEEGDCAECAQPRLYGRSAQQSLGHRRED